MLQSKTNKKVQPKTVARNRAAGILVSGEFVLLQKKTGDDHWALPGGRIEFGETAEQAFVREIQEEIGWHACPVKLVCILENLFEHENQINHEVGFYFYVDATGLLNHAIGFEADAEFKGLEKNLIFKWSELQNLRKMDLRPSMIIPFLKDFNPDQIVHLASGFT